MPLSVRPFDRRDRDQLTALVNLHIGSVLPGVAVSTNTVLSQLEREPGEVIVDPWVEQRVCLVAERDQAITAAALVHRFGRDDRVNEGYRAAAEIRWLIAAPDDAEAGRAVLDEAVATARHWHPTRLYGDVNLPAPACVGLSDSWPHLRRLFIDAGFTGPARIEQALAAPCHQLVGPEWSGPSAGLRRSVGVLGTRLDLLDDGESVGFIEVGEIHPALARGSAAATWTDVGNLFASDPDRLTEVMPALFSAAADWLLLGGVERLIDYYADDHHQPEYLDILHKLGFATLTVNQRGWELDLTGPQPPLPSERPRA